MSRKEAQESAVSNHGPKTYLHQNDLESVLEMQNPILHSYSPMQNPILQSQISIPKYAEPVDDLYVLESFFFFNF